MIKIPKEHEMKVVVIIMVFFMTMVITFTSNLIKIGFGSDFFLIWLKAWGMAYLTALPVALIAMPIIKKGISRFVE